MVIIILVLSALLAPTPDVVTLLIMAVPTYLLFEISLLITGFVVKNVELAAMDFEDDDIDDETPDSADEPQYPESNVNFSAPASSRNNHRRRKIRSRR